MCIVFLKKSNTTFSVTKRLLDHNNHFDYKDTRYDTKMHR